MILGVGNRRRAVAASSIYARVGNDMDDYKTFDKEENVRKD